MKIIKRLLLIFVIFFIVLIGFAIAIPIIYKDQIVTKVKEEVNKTVNAKVEFGDIGLSLFKNFPNFTFELNDFKVDGIDDFEGVTLAKGDQMAFTINLGSLLSTSTPMEIKSVTMDKPALNVVVLKNGKANYDIAKPTDERIEETASETDYSAFAVQLNKYAITDANIVYDDRAGDMFVEIQDLDHSGNGNFTLEVFDLTTETSIQSIDVKQGGISMLKKATMGLDATFNIDQANSKYTLQDNQFRLNDLILNADGHVQMGEEDIYTDITFNSPQTNFKSIWSLIPNAYMEGYESIDITGGFDLNGFVKGAYNMVTGDLPGFGLKLNAKDGNVKYPDLPMGLGGINANVDINSPSSDLDKLTVNVPRFAFRLGDNPFDGRFLLATPMSDPRVDTKVTGVINLAEMAKAVPMDDIQQLKGIIDADVELKASMSQIEKEAYEDINVKGYTRIQDMAVEMQPYPVIAIKDADVKFSPQSIKVASFISKLGDSDLSANGNIDNLLAWFSPEKTMTGNFVVRSKYFFADEWMVEAPATTETTAPPVAATPEEADAGEVFDRFDFSVDAEFDKVVYDAYTIEDIKAKGKMAPNDMSMENFQFRMGESDMSGNGQINNAFGYLFGENELLTGNVNLRSNKFDLNPFMTEDGSTPPDSGSDDMATEEMDPIILPENIDMKINADFNELIYTNMTLEDLRGKMVVTPDRTVQIQDGHAKTLGGDIDINGGYFTREGEEPKFSFAYDMKKMDFRQVFSTFNSFEQLAPIGKNIVGTFSTDLTMDGTLGKGMMPDLNSLNVEGFLETINSVIKGYAPLRKVGETLNMNSLKEDIKISGTKNWFTVKDGKVSVKEFDANVANIPMKIGGSHSLENEMDYNIKAAIPSKLLGGNALTDLASSGLKSLGDQASKLGLNIGGSDNINVLINLTGSSDSPKVKLKLLGADGEGSATETVKEAVTETVKDKVNAESGKILEDAQKQADKLVAEAKVQADKLRAEGKKAGDKIRKEGKSAAKKIKDEARKQAADINKKAKAEADKLVAQASNPIAKIAAKKAADIALKEAKKQSDKVVKEADKKAQQVEDTANKNADNTEKKAEDNAQKIEDKAQQQADDIMKRAKEKAKL